MKHFKIPKPVYLIGILLLMSIAAIGQEVPFTGRLTNAAGENFIQIRGDYTFLANSALNRVDFVVNASNQNVPYNGNLNNNSWHREYIDIDGDPSTFGSTSSNLTLPDPECSKIIYAGLYWAGNYDVERRNNFVYPAEPQNDLTRNDFSAIKFKVPGGNYVDIQADTAADPVGEEDEIIVDGFADGLTNSPYVCYKNVTNMLTSLADPEGDYFVGNVRGTRGFTSYGVAGWTLVVVYENPNFTGRNISIFDGYAGVRGRVSNGDATAINDINISGFKTVPAGPVNARIGAAILEGDRRIRGDQFSIATPSSPAFVPLSNPSNPANNFFNSNVTIDGANVNNRNINSLNTLGYDADIFNINNPANSIIANGETDATLRLSTNGDFFGAFLVTFGIEVIEPSIRLEKRVEDIAGNDITGDGVNLGQLLDYVLSFENIGNDDARGYVIRDVLPVNTTIDESNLTLPPGVTHSFNPANNEVSFFIPDNLVEIGDPISEIRIRVGVASNCFDFVDACQNTIQNIAFSTYRGVFNDNEITDDPSVTDFDACGFAVPGATNFLLDDLSTCDFSRTVQLCGADVLLDAGDNFDAYVWYRDENENRQIDAADTVITDADADNDPSTFLVDETGIYIVDLQIAAPCIGFQEIITVELFGNQQTNPITDLINDTTNTVEGEIVVCPNDGSVLPQIFLCGVNDTELIQVNIPDADSIEWERLDESSCPAVTQDCANNGNSCVWNTVETGSDFVASDSGQYRLIVNYQNGCFSRFFFNIFKNPLDPQFNATDIICNTPGNITVTNVPTDYEFQLLDAISGNILVPYNPNPSFTINSNGAYSVQLRQTTVADGCVFQIENIGVRERDFSVDVTTRDTDCNGLGEISISVLDVEPQYNYQISQGGSVVDTFGPSSDNNFTFQGLNDGVYDILVTSDDGCSHTEQVTINDVSDLAASALTTKNIDCTEGIITVNATGGFPDPDYAYAIWSVDGTDLYTDISDIPGDQFQSTPDFLFIAGEEGAYEFVVVDANNCFFVSNAASIVIAPSVEYTTSVTDENCLGASDGAFAVNVTNTNGYILSYLLTFPDTTTTISNTSGSFTGLPQGDYSLTITQTQGTVSCDFIEPFTVGGPVDSVAGTTIVSQDFTCLQEAIVEVQSVAGGATPYEYSIDGVSFGSANSFSNLTEGTYAITIRDGNGCTFVTNSVVVEPLNPPTALTFGATLPTCPALSSDVTVTAVDGNAPYVFEVISPAPITATSITGNAATFDDLAANTYIFRVTDAKGCTFEESFTIAQVAPIRVTGQLISNITCFDDTDGELLYTVTGFKTSYDYTVTGPATFSGTAETTASISLTNLDDGDYTITVTDNDTNCSDTAVVTINGPPAPLALNAIPTQPTCVVDGSTTLESIGGWGGNTFVLDYPDGTTSATNTTGFFNGLSQDGTYTGTVTDANGCVVTTTFQLTAAIPPVLEVVPNDFCYNDNVGLSLTANVLSGGDGNFEYSLNGGAFSSANIFSNLGPGTYNVTVRDGSECEDTVTLTINPELAVIASAANITACDTTTDVLISATGGDTNYSYAVVADGTTPNTTDFGSAATITITGAGDYDVYVRDNNGNTAFCEAAFDITISQDAALELTVTNTDILCSGDTSTISIAATGGESPYQYSIDDGSTYQVSNSFPNLPAGSYNVRVIDANNCDVTAIQTITEPLALSASAAVSELAECNPGLGAEVRITNANGGVPSYEYSFDGGASFSPNPINFLFPGLHNLLVRDANGCILTLPLTVEPVLTPPDVTTTVDSECDGEGTITVGVSDPSFDYTFALDGGPAGTADSFSDVAPGPHTITVNYIRNTPVAPSVLLLENFGTGADTTIPEIDGDFYCYEPQNGNATACSAINGRATNSPNFHIDDLEYAVTQAIVTPFPTWQNPNDASLVPNGRFLAVNVGDPGVNTIVYARRNVEVIANLDVEITLAIFNLVRAGSDILAPDILVELVDSNTNAVITSGTTGLIPENNGPDDWFRPTALQLNPGINTRIDIVIRTVASGTNGNDIAIDDILAIQFPNVCPSSLDVDVVVPSGTAFDSAITATTSVSCNGQTNGSITIEASNFGPLGFQYSVNGGAFTTSTTSPVTITGLTAQAYAITVQDLRDTGNCSTVLNETLTQPENLIASASISDVFSCTNGGATITASAIGGTPVYNYQLEDTAGTVISPFQATASFAGIAPGDYSIRVRDTNGCEDTIDAALTISVPETIAFTITGTECYSGANDATITADVTAGNGNYSFRINGGPWENPTPTTATTHTFNNLGAGTHTIEVRDALGCTAPSQDFTIDPALSISGSAAPITSCATTTDVDITAAGGDGNYVFAIVADGTTPTTADFSTTNPQTNGGPGSFDVYVRDNSGTAPFCEAVFDLDIIQDAPIAITPTVTDISCNGATTGSIDLAVIGGSGPYQYQLEDTSSAVLVPFQNSSSFNNLGAGTNYIVRVQDNNGCETTLPITITEADALVAEAVISQAYTCLQLGEIAVGSVTATTGGSSNYQYRIDGGAWSTATTGGITFTDLIDGTHSVEVRDANTIGCVLSLPNIVIPPLPTEPTLSSSIVYDCDGSGTITISPFDPSFTYILDGVGPGQTGTNANVFSNTPIGNHSITVDYGSGCNTDIAVLVENGNAFDAALIGFTDINCNGLATGELLFEVANFDATNGFEYAIDGGAFSAPQTTSPITITGLAAGNYTVEVRDVLNNSCSISFTQTLSEPAAIATTASITDPFTCINGGATITADATGGTPVFVYQLEDISGGIITTYQANNTFTGVAPGDYIIRARDANNCEDAIDSPITISAPNTLAFTTSSVSCYSGASDATIQIDVTNGNGNYQFSLNGGPFITPSPSTSTTHIFDNLTDGSYTIDVRDGFGCSAIQEVVIINPVLAATASLDSNLTCLAPAQVTLNASGGSGTYTYEWSSDGGASFNTTNFTANVFNTSTDGTFVFRVTDTTTPASCEVLTTTVTINPAVPPVITTVTPSDLLCNGDVNGSLDVVIDTSVGNPPYVISVLETLTSTNYGTQTTGLPAGDYEVTITDDNGCTSAPFAVSISEPSAIVPNSANTDISCSATGTQLGTITVDASGGNGPYIYRLNNNDFSVNLSYDTSTGTNATTFTGLNFGDYTLTVTDSNNCQHISTVTIANPPDVLITTAGAAGCLPGSGEMTVRADTSSGSLSAGPFFFALFPAPAYDPLGANPNWFAADPTLVPANPPGFTFTGLIPGVTYTFLVYDDATGCEFIQQATVPVATTSNIVSTIDATQDITCTGAADGMATFTVSGYGGLDISYQLFTNITNVAIGTPTTISGGIGGPETATVTGIAPGEYYLLFTEVDGPNTGCVVTSVPFLIQQAPALLEISATATNDNSCSDVGTITANAQFGAPAYEYQLEDSVGAIITAYQSSPNFIDLADGNYTVRVRDANGCDQTATVTVGLDPTPQISLAIVDECVDEGTFEVLVTLDNPGVSPYQLGLNGGAFQNITFNGSNQYLLSGLSSGLAQTITVRGVDGCGDTATFDITPPLQFSATLSTLLDCEAVPNNSAEITIEVSAGSGTYEYEVTGPVNQAQAPLPANPFVWNQANLPGTYTVTVFDVSTAIPHCMGSFPVLVPDVVTPIIANTAADATCNGANDGSIAVQLTDNGLSPVSYTITPVAGTFNPATNTFENLSPDTYTLTATGSNSCFTSITDIVISEPNPITIPTAVVAAFECSTGNTVGNASITIDETGINGGSGTYVIYEFVNDRGTAVTSDDIVVQSGSNTTYIETAIAGGTYLINVFDSNGCVGTTNATIAPYIEISSPTITLLQDVSCSPGNDAQVQLAVTSTPATPAPTLAYSVTGTDNGFNVANQASDTFTGLGVGNYLATITNTGTGCAVQIPFEINDPNNFEITTTTTDVVCFGDNGTVSFSIDDTVNPYTGGFDWQIFETQGTSTLADDVAVAGASGTSTNIGPSAPFAIGEGTYRVDIVQSVNPVCTNTAFFNIAGPAEAITATPVDTLISCLGNDGSIEITNTSGGWGNYSYYVSTIANPDPQDVSNYGPNPRFDNLGTGTYEIWVIDGNGCAYQAPSLTLADPDPINAALQVNTANCSGIEGELEVVSVVGGQGSNYTYQLIRDGLDLGAPQTSTIFSNLGEGSYEVRITDQLSCSFTTPAQVLFDEIIAVPQVVKLIDCSVNPGGQITVTQTGGSGAFDYVITFPDGTTTQNNTTGVFADLTQVGTYTITITDQAVGHACVSSIQELLEAAVLPVISIASFSNETCAIADDGILTVSGIDNGNAPFNFQITAIDGTALATSINPSSNTGTTATFTGLTGSIAGSDYTITAVSANGCTATINQLITEPQPISVPAITAVEFSCAAGNAMDNATLSIDEAGITGGSGNYVRFEFINNQGTATTADDVIVQTGSNSSYIESNPAGGSYTINVIDDNGCVGTTNANILAFDELISATTAISNPLSCNPGTDGEVTITVTTTNADLTRLEFSVDNGLTFQASNVFGGLAAGTHNFLVRHLDTGCVITASETLLDPNTFDVDINIVSDVICFGEQTGEVTLELIDPTYTGAINWIIYDTNGTPNDPLDDTLVDNNTFPTTGPTTPIALFAGNYLVELVQVDHPACTQTRLFTIAGPPAEITADVIETPISCLGNDGSITVTNIAGGWGGYTYFVGTTAPAAAADFVASATFTGLGVGTYEAWIRDVQGCERQVQTGIILADPTPITATLQINQENCTALQGEIEVVGTTGGQNSNYTYQLVRDGLAVGSPQTDTTFTNLADGTYTVIIEDQLSCTHTTNAVTLFLEINLTTSVIKPIDCTATPDGEITITATGGSSSLEYLVTFPDGTTTVTNTNGVFSGLSQVGEYTFTITDLTSVTPCVATITQNLIAPTPITFDTPDLVNISCAGGSDGIITVVLQPEAAGVNDNPVYTYNLYDNTGVLLAGPQNNPTFTGLAQGSYEIEAISGKGCTDILSVSLTEPNPLQVTASATAFACAPDNTVITGNLTVNATEGTAPYLYSIDNVNFQTSNTFNLVDSGSVQNITVFVTDANSCMQTASVTLEPLNVFTVDVTQNIAINCVNPEEVLLTVTDNGNATNTYTYELLPIGNPDGAIVGTPSNTTAIFNLTDAGTYTFRITDTITNCYVDTAEYVIAPFDTIEVLAADTASAICFGDTDGALEITVDGYTGPYSYEVFDSNDISTGVTGTGSTTANPLAITGLSGGNYYVRVRQTNNPLCEQDSNTITIASPDAPLAFTPLEAANVTCTNDQGEIEVSPNGGFAPYDIVVTNTTTGQSYTENNVRSFVFGTLSEGAFTIAVTDNAGCVVTEPLTLVAPLPITADITGAPTSLICFGDTDATVSATNVANGSGTYLYQLNTYDATGTDIVSTGGPQSTPTYTNLGAGIYSITISDGLSCDLETIQVTIDQATEVMSSLVQNTQLTCTNLAETTLTASGGNGPYQFSVDGGVFTPMSGGNTHSFTVPEGVYQYLVIDSNGCEARASNIVTVDAVPPLTIDVDDSAARILCFGESNALIIADVTGGLGNYSYELYGDSAFSNLVAGPQTSDTFSNLGAGSYFIRVTSGDCIEETNEILITEPAALQITQQESTNVSCAGFNNGTISVEVTGGTGDIFYAITPNLNQFDTQNTFTALAPGIYDVVAQDENGCFESFQFTITEPEPIMAEAIDITHEICVDEEDGTFELLIEGGTAPYSTALNSNANSDYILDRTTFQNLAPGNHVVFVRDAMGCEVNVVVEILPGVNIAATVTPIYECDGILPTNSLDVVFEEEAIMGDVIFGIDTVDPLQMILDPDFGSLPPGDHILSIVHENGCLVEVPFTIDDFEPLSLVLEQNNLNEITAVVEGGSEDYTFFFDEINNGSENTFIINRTDTYPVRVVDTNGCEVAAAVFIEFIDIEIPDFFTPDGDGTNDTFVPNNLEAFPNTLIVIFDRYGRELYQFSAGDPGWNGEYQNSELPTGDYWYVIRLQGERDEREFVGHFTLYR